MDTEHTFTMIMVRDAFTEWAKANTDAQDGVRLSQLWGMFLVELAHAKRRELHYMLDQLEGMAHRTVAMNTGILEHSETERS